MWKDATSYSQGDAERKPTAWSRDVGDLRIVITCAHIYHKGEWVMHCRPWFDTHPLNLSASTGEKDAQIVALDLVRKKISALYKAIQSV